MKRSSFRHGGLNLSFLDSGGNSPVIIALHAHWMEGATFSSFSELVCPAWRVVALDQRGHGYSDHADTYTVDDYLGDLEALFDHLALKRAVILGNSLGGVNAYKFASRHPERVPALVIEDIGVEISSEMPSMAGWDGTFATQAELEKQIGPRMLPYLASSFRRTAAGWRLAFEPRHMRLSQASVGGDHWAAWLSTNCPALLIRGSDSRVTPASHVEDMAKRRAHTRLCTLDAGHIVHQDNPAEFADGVLSFLRSLC